MNELIELAKQSFAIIDNRWVLDGVNSPKNQRTVEFSDSSLVKFAALIEAKQSERIAELEKKLCHAELAAEAEANEVDKRGKRIAKLEAALIRLRDCDWVVTWADRMDAVRDIAKEALDA